MRDLAVHESGEIIDLAALTAGHEQLLQAILARETRPRTRPGELRCAMHEADMYLRVVENVTYACHWRGTGLTPHPVALMSTEHRTQVEYVARAADRAGLETATEVALPTRVKPDLVIGCDTAVEVQRSHLTVAKAKSRTTKAIRGGMAVSLWISEKEPKYAPAWMYSVPSATAHARDWQSVPPLGSATVTGGLRRISTQPCRPPHRTSCPETGRHWCGRWHLIHEPLLGVSLDDLAVGVATGQYLPASIFDHVLLAAAEDVERYGVTWGSPLLTAAPPAPDSSRARYECRSVAPNRRPSSRIRPNGRARSPELYLALRSRPDWPTCSAGCGWPVDPAAGETHPMCGPRQIA